MGLSASDMADRITGSQGFFFKQVAGLGIIVFSCFTYGAGYGTKDSSSQQ